MIKFIHTADTHFGMENYGKIDAASGLHSRLLDFKINLDRVVQRAISEQVDFFLLCGDAYKTANPTPTQQKLLMECMFTLYRAKIPVVIVVGNHDHPLSFGRAHALDVFAGLPLDGFHVFSRPGILKLATKNGAVQIVGLPWPTRNNLLTLDEYREQDHSQLANTISLKVASIIQGFANELDPSLPAVLASHLTVASGVFSGSEKTAIIGSDPILLPSQLAIAPFNYVALGHLHRNQNLAVVPEVPIVYSGSIEAIDFGEIRDKKGFCLVSIETKGNSSGGFARTSQVEFCPLPTRKMLHLEVDVGTGLEQTERLAKEINAHEIAGSIVKIHYQLPPTAVDCVDLAKIQELLKTAMHVVCVKPIKGEITRQVRARVEHCQDVDALLKQHLQGKGYEHRLDVLLNKANEIMCCVQNDELQEAQSKD